MELTTEEEEKRRVIDAAKCALKGLRAAKKDLDSAARWGILDVIGGMYVVSGIKHLKVESAKGHIREAMIYLQQYRKEDDGTDYVNQKYMHLGIFGTVLDVGFDGVGPDVYAQARILGLRSRVKEAISRVETLLMDAGIDPYN